MKRFFLVFLTSLFLAATFVAFYSPTIVKASSIYDDIVQLKSFPLQAAGGTVFNNSFDIGLFLGSGAAETARSQCVGFSNSITSDYFNRVVTALQNDNPYAISYVFEDSLDDQRINLAVLENPSTITSTWNPTNMLLNNVDSPQWIGLSITYTTYQGRGMLVCGNTMFDTPNSTVNNFIFANNTTKPVEIFGFNITYPSGYEGQIIPTPEAPGDKFTPEIGYYTTIENVLFANFIGGSDARVPSPGGYVIPFLRWTVYQSDGTTVLDSRITDTASPYEYRLPGIDTYYFEVTYVSPLEAGEAGDLPFPNRVPFDDNVVLVPVRFVIEANGTLIMGSSLLNTCSEVGGTLQCEAGNPLEDCSTYGVDLGGYFQCTINNFGIKLRNTIIQLFVPKYSFFNGWVTTFGDFLNTKLGFVYSSFGFIGGLFNGIITNGASTACVIAPPGTLFDAPFEVDVCKLQEVVGNTVFQLIQGIVISLTILALMFAGYRKYLEVVDHR